MGRESEGAVNPAISLRKVFRVKTELKIMWQLGGKDVLP